MDHGGFGSEGGPAIRVDSAKDFPMEPVGADVAAKTTEAALSFGMILTLLTLAICCVLPKHSLVAVFRLWVRQLQGSRPIFPRGPGVT